MYSVTQEPKRAADVAVGPLNKHESKVQTSYGQQILADKESQAHLQCEISDSPRVFIAQYSVNKRARLASRQNEFRER